MTEPVPAVDAAEAEACVGRALDADGSHDEPVGAR